MHPSKFSKQRTISCSSLIDQQMVRMSRVKFLNAGNQAKFIALKLICLQFKDTFQNSNIYISFKYIFHYLYILNIVQKVK